MLLFLHWILLVSLISLGLCDLPQQQQDAQFSKFPGLIPIKVKRRFRSLSPTTIIGNGLPRSLQSYSPLGMPTPDYTAQLRQKVPRWPYAGDYQLPLYATAPRMMGSLYPYRRSLSPLSSSDLDTSVGDEADMNASQSSLEQNGRLRFLGWLFGRPSVSRYPDYSILEEAAGISYGSRPPPVGYPRPHSPYVVEDCVELLDPYTDHIVEECQEVPYYH